MPFDCRQTGQARSGLNNADVAQTLKQLHHQASGRDALVFARALPAIIAGKFTGRSTFEAAEPYLAKAFIPVSEEFGRFMYLTALSRGSKNIVEFGSSYGISSIYLAAAARETGGFFTGTEKDSAKAAVALENLDAAGLSRWSDIREGDALESLAPLEGPVDFLFLDGWKDLYIPVLKLLEPKFAPGAIVFADNIHSFRKTLKPFVDYISDTSGDYETTILDIGSGVSFSVWRKAH
ncbi:O-methyltransferase [Hyphomonas jannaschiana]|uniref:O-methyltransferase n=1 Tax=Hyphomonas jannaschiana VP2 TaxID=1280952 RepID=A0A059FEM5_9PROT|nr:class I SAM-dependent methyltransferase [Hyphomonas jannaschiana]KCZ89006.1 O-methyltransferase [Hyphomonas jannaschiana VP2]